MIIVCQMINNTFFHEVLTVSFELLKQFQYKCAFVVKIKELKKFISVFVGENAFVLVVTSSLH